MQAVERLAVELDGIATVGRLQAFPGGVNVVPGLVEFSLDVRAEHDGRRDALVEAITAHARESCAVRGLGFELTETHTAAGVYCDPALTESVVAGIAATGDPDPLRIWSRAGHDAMALAADHPGRDAVRALRGRHQPRPGGERHPPGRRRRPRRVRGGRARRRRPAVVTGRARAVPVRRRRGVRERVEAVWADLTPSERQVARFVLEHADDLAGYSGAELAERCGASKATVSRFFRRLGFPSYAQARARARADARSLRDARRPHREPERGRCGGARRPRRARTSPAPPRTLAHVDLDAVITALAGARRVLVLGWRNSYPVALHLREQLLQARAEVSVGPQPGQTVAEEVAGLDRRDLLVVVGFRRRTPAVAAVLGLAADLGVPCVLLTDPAAGPPPVAVAHRLEVPVEGPGAFDSYAAVMTTVAVLAEGVLDRAGRAGRDRVRALARAHEALAELEQR